MPIRERLARLLLEPRPGQLIPLREAGSTTKEAPRVDAGCAGCGDCCRAIAVPMPHVRFLGTLATAERYPGWIEGGELLDPTTMAYEHWFIATRWRPIPKEEAVRRVPGLGDPGFANRSYYECAAFDPETARCTEHAARPSVCRGFPWYGPTPHEPGATGQTPGGFPRCSYWHDVPREQWPPGTDPLPAPNGDAPVKNVC